MNLSGEDWLNDEKFDFNLNLSKSSVEDGSLLNVPNDIDDDEVFIGTVTHKEKCVAVLVQEKEDIKTLQTPSAQEQALLLRESALIALRIKSQETPGRSSNTTRSPIAIVRPMKRDYKDSMEDNKENIIPTTDLDLKVIEQEWPKKELVIPPVSSSSQIDSNLVYSSSEIDGSSSQTKVDLSDDLKHKPAKLVKSFKKATPNKSRLSLPSKPSSNKVPESGLSNKVKPSSIAGVRDVDLQKKIKKPLMIPKPSITKSISANGIPLASSSLPSRAKQNGGTSTLKPLKPPSQIGIPLLKKQPNKVACGIVQPNLKLLPRKCPSDTSLENKTVTSSSLQKLQSTGNKQGSVSNTPGKKGIPKVTKSEGKQTTLVTPVLKASRKSIVGRKLNPTPSKESSRNSSPVEEFRLIDDPVQQETESVVACENVMPVSKKVPTAADILERYRSMNCSKQNVANKDDDSINDMTSNFECEKVQDKQESLSADCIEYGDSIININESTNVDYVVKNDTGVTEVPISSISSSVPYDNNPTSSNEVAQIKESVIDPISTPLLIDIEFTDSEVSPVKVNNIDPFETGNTPPPLIQLDAVLVPERPPEMNLIEF